MTSLNHWHPSILLALLPSLSLACLGEIPARSGHNGPIQPSQLWLAEEATLDRHNPSTNNDPHPHPIPPHLYLTKH